MICRPVLILYVLLSVTASTEARLAHAAAFLPSLQHGEKTMLTVLGNYIQSQDAQIEPSQLQELERFHEWCSHESDKSWRDPDTTTSPVLMLRVIYRMVVSWDHVLSTHLNQGHSIVCEDEEGECAGLLKENCTEEDKRVCKRKCNECSVRHPDGYKEFNCDEKCQNPKSAAEVLDTYRTLRESANRWPGVIDLSSVARRTVRLAELYQVTPRQVVQGALNRWRKLKGTAQEEPLEPELVLLLAENADRSDSFDSWRNLVLELGSPSAAMFGPDLQRDIKHSDIWLWSSARDNIGFETVISRLGSLALDGAWFVYDSIVENLYERVLSYFEPSVHQAGQSNYHPLCRGEPPVQVRTKKTKGYCYLHKTFVSYGPWKAELLSESPRIVIFYDVISDAESREVTGTAFHELDISGTVGDNGAQSYSDVRISLNTFLSEGDSPVVARLNRRVQEMTGLSVTDSDPDSAEQLQVVNYGLGGMYEPHYDFFINAYTLEEDEYNADTWATGDRIATFLFYLSDVSEGGATVFPGVGARVPARKGSAVFWYNLDEWGRPDEYTLHAGCPVLFGSKWIANKWIRANSQMFLRKCPLHPPPYDAEKSYNVNFIGTLLKTFPFLYRD